MNARYEIRVRGAVSPAIASAFEEFTAAVKPAETIMRGEIRDQSELQSVLNKLQQLGFELVEVRQLPENGRAPSA